MPAFTVPPSFAAYVAAVKEDIQAQIALVEDADQVAQAWAVSLEPVEGELYGARKYAEDAKVSEGVAAAAVASKMVYVELVATPAFTLDMSAADGLFDITLNDPEVVLTIPVPDMADGWVRTAHILLRQGTGANQVVWPSNVKWIGNQVPRLTYDVGSFDSVALMAHKAADGTAAWVGYYNGGWHNA